MLIGKVKEEVKVGDVAALRLVTGEEIIGKVSAYDGYTISISKPVQIQIQMVAPNQAGITFAPFMVSVEEDGDFSFVIASSLSLLPKKARADLTANYLKATTGLDIPATPGIIRA